LLDVLMQGENYCDDGFIAVINQKPNGVATTVSCG